MRRGCSNCFPNQSLLEAGLRPLPTSAPWGEPADRAQERRGVLQGGPQTWEFWVHCFPADLNVDDGVPWWLAGTMPVLRIANCVGGTGFLSWFWADWASKCTRG